MGKRIAIACQGGGSQCAFVAGALDALFARRIQDRYSIVGLSGTSGGGLTAALAWTGLLEEARAGQINIGERVVALWKDLSAQTPQEILFDKMSIDMVRLIERGMLPSMAMSPSSPQFQLITRTVSMFLSRPEFTDLRALVLKHFDFEAISALIGPQSPALVVGAGDVLEGTFKIFSSANREITAEALLASAAIPNLFPAVWANGHAYWDGIFSSNPPIIALFQKPYIGQSPRPEEVWIVQVNRAQHDFVPETPSDISDRRNQLAGNLSLQHEIQVVDMVNTLLQNGGLTEAFRERFGLDMTHPVAIRFIRMSTELQKNLDYPSKLSRQPEFIERLMAHGRDQANDFLSKLEGPGPAAEAAPGVPVVESVEPRSPGLA